MRIVIADDSQTARMFIIRCMQIAGFQSVEFVEAGNGKEALSHLKKTPANLLVTDLNMPVMDGETLLKWIKGNPRLTDLPVVVITSAGNPAKETQLLQLGARCVLNKPVNPAILQEHLEPLLGQGEH